jgi:hypothetical protein
MGAAVVRLRGLPDTTVTGGAHGSWPVQRSCPSALTWSPPRRASVEEDTELRKRSERGEQPALRRRPSPPTHCCGSRRTGAEQRARRPTSLVAPLCVCAGRLFCISRPKTITTSRSPTRPTLRLSKWANRSSVELGCRVGARPPWTEFLCAHGEDSVREPVELHDHGGICGLNRIGVVGELRELCCRSNVLLPNQCGRRRYIMRRGSCRSHLSSTSLPH